MIPKKIHYIWLGGNPLPEMVVKCMESWKKFCPDYEIIKWDESNLNIDINEYCRQAYDKKKYAFASDVLRFDILKREGGIYLDVDVELLKSFDDLLDCKAFAGLEMSQSLNVAPGLIFASEKDGKVVSEILEIYNKSKFLFKDGSINYETVCTKTTNCLVKNYGLKLENVNQDLGEIIIYSTEYFCPINFATKEEEFLTKNTYSKHLYLASWSKKPSFIDKIKLFFKKLLKKIIGKKNYQKLKNKVKGTTDE